MPRFVCKTNNHAITVDCLVVPELVLVGEHRLPGIECIDLALTGRTTTDDLLAETLAYQITEGHGIGVNASGTIEASDNGEFPEVAWSYHPN